MKRKLICFIIFTFSIINAFSKERFLTFKVIEDTSGFYYDGRIRLITYKKNDIITSSSSISFLHTSSYAELNGDSNSMIYAFDNIYNSPAIKTNYLIPEKTKDLLPDSILTYKKNDSKRLIFSNFVDFLYFANVEKFDDMDSHYRADYIKHSDFVKKIEDPFFNVVLTNVGLHMYTADSIGFLNIKKINNNKYKCIGIALQGFELEAFDYEDNPFGWPGILETTPDDTFETFIFTIDGEYIELDNETTGKHIGTLVYVDDSVIEELCNLLKTSKCDLSRVIWPRHADGTCDYDGSNNSSKTAVSTSSTTPKQTTNVTVNKLMSVTENLKLRSGKATTTSVLTVMSAGTKVKILKLGKAENIDGIDSNWVKVEVQKGAKDRDGKEIKAGTVGWCYGGYLK